MSSEYVPTAEAARAVGFSRNTLLRWAREGLVTPAYRSPGGHARWDIADLQRQLKQLPDGQVETSESESASTLEHQPVVAAIVTSALGVLAGRRNDGKPLWTFIAGEIEPGESQAHAAVREVKEETGLVVTAAAHEIGRRVHPKTGRTMIYLACSPVQGTGVFVGDPEELAEVRWLSLAETTELLPGMFEPVREHLVRALSSSRPQSQDRTAH